MHDDDFNDDDIDENETDFLCNRDAAIEAVQDLLLTQQEFDEATRWMLTDQPDARLVADEEGVYALLGSEDQYGIRRYKMYQIVKRTFIASCSSSWSTGLIRTPGCRADFRVWKKFGPGGMCDPFEEFDLADIRKGLENAHHLIKTRRPASAGTFGVIVLEMHDAYGSGWRITDEFFDKLNKFRDFISNGNLNQAGYQVIRRQDNHVVLILEGEPDTYDKYLYQHIKELHAKVPICVGASHGDLYYRSENEVFSEAINRLWLQMRNLPAGAVVVDGTNGQKVADRIGMVHQILPSR